MAVEGCSELHGLHGRGRTSRRSDAPSPRKSASGVWKNIIDAQRDEKVCLDIGEALNQLRLEIMPDISVFLGIRPALAKMKQGSMTMTQFARHLDVFSSKIGRFCKFFKCDIWMPNSADLYSSFVAGLNVDQ